ncbi:hypothetical protein ACGFJT_44210 [Actinomadura geliboluensis]|uniref:hypothetical protein n=1 Tax=Actinomadura geliboluensis TaxID=882440 RepID=UPI003717DBF0
MSGQQHGLPSASQLSLGFGFVTPEDRARWEQARRYSQRKSAAKEMIASSLEAALELGQQGIQAKLRAAYQVEAEQQQERSRTTTRTITEVVDFEDRDDRQEIDPSFEF